MSFDAADLNKIDAHLERAATEIAALVLDDANPMTRDDAVIMAAEALVELIDDKLRRMG